MFPLRLVLKYLLFGNEVKFVPQIAEVTLSDYLPDHLIQFGKSVD